MKDTYNLVCMRLDFYAYCCLKARWPESWSLAGLIISCSSILNLKSRQSYTEINFTLYLILIHKYINIRVLQAINSERANISKDLKYVPFTMYQLLQLGMHNNQITFTFSLKLLFSFSLFPSHKLMDQIFDFLDLKNTDM